MDFAKELQVTESVESKLAVHRTHPRRMTYIRNNYVYIELLKVYMGPSFERRKENIVRVLNYGYIAPVKQTLEHYLNHKDVFEAVCTDRTKRNGLMTDFCDAALVKNSEYINSHDKCLQIIFNHDSLQVF